MQATVAAAAPARKALAIQSSLVYQTYNWEHYPDDTMSREPTEVQQPQLDDAWKHLQVNGHRCASQPLAATKPPVVLYTA
jgi:hypothetical protein